MTNNYSISKNWSDKEDLHFTQTLTDAEQEVCRTVAGLLKIFSGKVKPQHNEIILSLHYCKLSRLSDQTAA